MHDSLHEVLLPRSFFAAIFCFGFIFNIPFLLCFQKWACVTLPTVLPHLHSHKYPSDVAPYHLFPVHIPSFLPTERSRQTGLQLVFINRAKAAGLNSSGHVFVLVKRNSKGRTTSSGHTPRLAAQAECGTCSSAGLGKEKGANPDLAKVRSVSSISKDHTHLHPLQVNIPILIYLCTSY